MNIYALTTLLLIVVLGGCSHSPSQDSEQGAALCKEQAHWLDNQAACDKEQTTNTSDIDLATTVAGVTWQLVGLKDNQQWLYRVNSALAFEQITLTFTDDAFSGQAACNGFFGQYAFDEQSNQNNISIRDIATTRKLCPPEQMESELALLMWLKKADAIALINEQLIITLNNQKLLVFVPAQTTDNKAQSDYQVCASSDNKLLLGANDSQCMLDGTVHFQDQRPSLSLQYCSHYFDGCNNHIVNQGQLGASTLMACPRELDSPVCYIDQRIYQKATGRVVRIDNNSIDIVFDDIVEVFHFENKSQLKQMVVGNEVSIEYSQGHDYQDKTLLDIWSVQ